jgi:hypothetical protein
MAKVSMRLVPDQDPDRIADLFEDYVKKIAPKTVEVKVTRMHGGKPWMASLDNPFVQAAGRAIEGVRQDARLQPRGRLDPGGGHLPGDPRPALVLFGVGLPDENAHAPNEKLDLGNFHGGIIASAYLYDEVAEPDALPPHELRRRRDAIWAAIHETPDFWTTLSPLDPAAVTRIHELMLRHGWEVFFITQRPATAGDTVQRQTQRWLHAHGFDLPSVLVTGGSRGAAAAAAQAGLPRRRQRAELPRRVRGLARRGHPHRARARRR